MKTFFASRFVSEEALNEARINYPIKLKYYKIINEEEEKLKFGIQIIKIEYRKEGRKVEKKEREKIESEEQKVEGILKILERNEVTPIELEEILEDIIMDKKIKKSLQNIEN